MIDEHAALTAARRHMRGAFRWGVADCCTAAADAWRDLHGRDPLERLRGRWGSADEAIRLGQAAGGLLRIMQTELEAIGLRRAPEAPGALAFLPGGPFLAGSAALCIRPGLFASKGRRGMALIKVCPEWVWSA